MPTLPTPTTLTRGVFDFVAIEQHAMGRRQGFAVLVEGLPDVRMDLSGGVVFPVEDRRELVFEERRPARIVYELGEDAFGGAALAGLRQALDHAAADRGILDGRDQRLELDGVVPQVQHVHLARTRPCARGRT